MSWVVCIIKSDLCHKIWPASLYRQGTVILVSSAKSSSYPIHGTAPNVCLSTHLLLPQARVLLSYLHNFADTDHDGTLCLEEVLSALAPFQGTPPDAQHSQERLLEVG
jgi:hypothetical protein